MLKTFQVRFFALGAFVGIVFCLNVGAAALQQEGAPAMAAWGQPRSEADMLAWNEISQAEDIEKKAKLAQDYIERFPNGGFVPYAHEILAAYHFQENDQDKFLEHAQTALQKLPNEPVLLANLSFVYAEKQQADEAIRHGEKGLELLAQDAQFSTVAAIDPNRQVQLNRLESDAHYGVGTGYLFKAYTSGGDEQLMKRALDHLQKAVEKDPQSEQAHFRLGFAFQMNGRSEEAVLEYARATALEGKNDGTVRQYLEQAYTKLHGGTKGMDQLVREQKALLLKE